MILTRIIATLKDVAKCSEVGCLHPLQSSLAKIVSWRCGQTGGVRCGPSHWPRLGQQTVYYEKEIYNYRNGDLEECSLYESETGAHHWIFKQKFLRYNMFLQFLILQHVAYIFTYRKVHNSSLQLGGYLHKYKLILPLPRSRQTFSGSTSRLFVPTHSW